MLSACASQRKISHVEVRNPASVRTSAAVSALRDQYTKSPTVLQACPAEIRELLPLLVEERVKFPSCPPSLEASYEGAREVLRSEEISEISDLLSNDCRLSRLNESSFGAFLDNLDPANANFSGQNLSPQELERRQALRSSLLEVKRVNDPLDRWIRNNGEFVISEEPLEFLQKIISHPRCRMTNEEVDLSYRTIRSLEDLAKIQKQGDPQRIRIELFLEGVHELIDKKIKEFF